MTIKPSEELLTVAMERVTITKAQQQRIAGIIKEETSRHIVIPGFDRDMTQRFQPDPRTEKYPLEIGSLVSGKRYFSRLQPTDKWYEIKKTLYESVVIDEYVPTVEFQNQRLFFSRLESAVESYIADIHLDEIRPTPSAVKKKLNQIKTVSIKMEKCFQTLDDRSRKAIEVNFDNIEQFKKHLHEIIIACEDVTQVKLSRNSQARFNLCLAVIKAMKDYNLKVVSTKTELTARLVRHLANTVAYGPCDYCKERYKNRNRIWVEQEPIKKCLCSKLQIMDVGDSLNAAMVEFRRSSKQG